ncbi:MAG TPA: DUF2382 domain-containing protein [Allosphingosinicella sp.]|jgi:hypothetical protein
MSGNVGHGKDDGAPRQSAVWVDAETPAGDARIGDARLVRGGAKVSAFTEEPPAADEPPRDRGRVLSDTEVAESGLLQERVIEIGEMREEAVVTKQAIVREELVVRKDIEERTERVSETLRRTEVDVEQLEAGPEPGDGGGDSGDVRAR